VATSKAIPESSLTDASRGMDLLDRPLLNKGTAFSDTKRPPARAAAGSAMLPTPKPAGEFMPRKIERFQ